MEDDSIYNAIIISLVIGIIIVIITLVVFRPEKESFTEIYFEDHESLPRYTNSNDEYSFRFTINNLENQDFKYRYKISVFEDEEDIIEENNVLIKNGESKTLEKSIRAHIEDKAKVQVTLVNKDQEIHFWIKSSKYYEYDGLGDGLIDCLNAIDVNDNNILKIKANGTYAEGWPILEVRINGKVVNSVEINESKEYELVLLKEGDVIDLVFVNDFQIIENEKIVEDRNLYVSYVKVGNKIINVIYDKGKDLKAFDCEDITNDLNMAWNGALRFKTE